MAQQQQWLFIQQMAQMQGSYWQQPVQQPVVLSTLVPTPQPPAAQGPPDPPAQLLPQLVTQPVTPSATGAAPQPTALPVQSTTAEVLMSASQLPDSQAPGETPPPQPSTLRGGSQPPVQTSVPQRDSGVTDQGHATVQAGSRMPSPPVLTHMVLAQPLHC